jgi:hypothetical protein
LTATRSLTIRGEFDSGYRQHARDERPLGRAVSAVGAGAVDLCGFFSDVLDLIELEAPREALGEPSKFPAGVTDP